MTAFHLKLVFLHKNHQELKGTLPNLQIPRKFGAKKDYMTKLSSGPPFGFVEFGYSEKESMTPYPFWRPSKILPFF